MNDYKRINMKPRISMVALGVDDLEISIIFYRDGLGFPIITSPPGVAFFNLNGTWLGLSNRKDLAKDVGISYEGSGYRGINLTHNVSTKEEVLEILNQAIEAGAKLLKEGQEADWGGFHGCFEDPDGHIWEVAYNPFMWVGPKELDEN